MANTNNPLLKGFRGQIAKTIVVKQYSGDRTIITAYPDMSKVKPSVAQLAAKARFADAVAYAREIRSQPIQLNEAHSRLAHRKGSIYHALIAEYMKLHPAV